MALRVCCMQKQERAWPRVKRQQALWNIYVTIMGIFLTTGVALDIKCSCAGTGRRHCCSPNDNVELLTVLTFVTALCWLLINKLCFDCLLSHESKRHRLANSRPVSSIRYFLTLVCGLAMVIIVISGIVALTFYSFNFEV